MEENRNFLESFAKAEEQMIATNVNAYRSYFGGDRQRVEKTRDYSFDEIKRIVSSGSLVEQRKLSNNYFNKDGYYKQIIAYYATLLKYAGILIPNPVQGKNLSQEYVAKRYNSALDFVETLDLPTLFTNCAQQALINGSYYGVISSLDKNALAIIDLPAQYCCSNFKDAEGNDLVEFDLNYFKTIVNLPLRKQALKVYPKEVSQAYYKWLNSKGPRWYIIPSSIGICFPIFDGRPMFLSVIPATIKYDDAMDTEYERNKEDIRKIITQQIPHLNDGQLLFEPDEAAEIHKGTVGMLSGNKNLSVLTTYADVTSIASNTNNDNATTFLKSSENNIYAQAGVSGELFTATGSTTLEQAQKNDLAMMMYLANKFGRFITNAINRVYGNGNIKFKYTILPISYYNQDKYIEESFKLAGSGYSLLLPAIATGLSQKDLSSIKDLENNVLKLSDKLKPLASAYTQSGKDGSDGGRPSKDTEDKTEKTVQKDQSLDSKKTEGGSK